MIIWTAKLSRKRLGIGAAALALLLVSAATVLTLLGKASPAGGVPDPKGIRTEESRRSFLSAYGWTLEDTPPTVEELVIPKKLGEEYRSYLELQSGQGFDLARYAGKRVTRYTYSIANYPTGERGVKASLLLYKDRVVGGEVLSPALNGFLHGLEMPGRGQKEAAQESS